MPEPAPPPRPDDLAREGRDALLDHLHHTVRGEAHALRSFAELLLAGRVGPLVRDQIEILRDVDEGSRELHQLGELLWELGRRDARPENPLHEDPAPLAALLRNATARLERFAATSGKALVYAPPESLAERTPCPRAWRRLLFAMGAAAIRQSAVDGAAGLRVEETAGGLRVEAVSDDRAAPTPTRPIQLEPSTPDSLADLARAVGGTVEASEPGAPLRIVVTIPTHAT